MQNNPLATIPKAVFSLSHLESLKLCRTGLEELDPRIRELSKLQALDLSDLNLTSLPPEIGNLSDLEVLDLTGNNLLELPETMGNLTKLEMLTYSRNGLTTLPAVLFKLPGLQHLDLSDNKIDSLPPAIPELEYLGLYYNNLYSVPKDLASVTEIDLRHNKLSCVPTELVERSKVILFDVFDEESDDVGIEGPINETDNPMSRVCEHLGFLLKQAGQADSALSNEDIGKEQIRIHAHRKSELFIEANTRANIEDVLMRLREAVQKESEIEQVIFIIDQMHEMTTGFVEKLYQILRDFGQDEDMPLTEDPDFGWQCLINVEGYKLSAEKKVAAIDKLIEDWYAYLSNIV